MKIGSLVVKKGNNEKCQFCIISSDNMLKYIYFSEKSLNSITNHVTVFLLTLVF